MLAWIHCELTGNFKQSFISALAIFLTPLNDLLCSCGSKIHCMLLEIGVFLHFLLHFLLHSLQMIGRKEGGKKKKTRIRYIE